MAGITVIPNIATSEEIKSLIDDILPQVSEKNMVYFADAGEKDGVKKANCNDHPTIDAILTRLSLTRNNLDIATFLCYPAGAFNHPHADNAIMENGQARRIKPWTHSAIVFLNKDFVGGELVYPNQGCTFTPTIGTYVLAPADIDYIHHVNRVRIGNRYTLVLRLII
jgi:predicted 2-oxoglutarate/Fe(II)-dependent dioxygenase YbiX